MIWLANTTQLANEILAYVSQVNIKGFNYYQKSSIAVNHALKFCKMLSAVSAQQLLYQLSRYSFERLWI